MTPFLPLSHLFSLCLSVCLSVSLSLSLSSLSLQEVCVCVCICICFCICMYYTRSPVLTESLSVCSPLSHASPRVCASMSWRLCPSLAHHCLFPCLINCDSICATLSLCACNTRCSPLTSYTATKQSLPQRTSFPHLPSMQCNSKSYKKCYSSHGNMKFDCVLIIFIPLRHSHTEGIFN